MEETREILITRTFTYGELLELLTDGSHHTTIESVEMKMPNREGNAEWRRIMSQPASPFFKVKYKEPLEKK